MDLAPELEAFWKELEAEPAEVLSEVEGLSQAQFDWRPAASEWSIGEVIHHPHPLGDRHRQAHDHLQVSSWLGLA